MSQRKWRGRFDKDKEFEAREARIVTILSVKNPVMRALVKDSYGEYCSFNAPVMSREQALAKWRNEPGSVESVEANDNNDGEFAGFFEDEVPNVEGLINEVMLQDSQQFNADHHDWFKRHNLSLHIAATCLISYNDGRDTATVTGTWCTLSKHVPLNIKGIVTGTDNTLGNGTGMHYVDTSSRPDIHGIDIGPIRWVRGEQFASLLREQKMPEQLVINYLQRFFSTSSADLPDEDEESEETTAQPSRPIIVASRNSTMSHHAVEHLSSGAMGGVSRVAAVTQARSAIVMACNKNRVTLADLWARFRAAEIDEKLLVETDSVALGTRLVLYARELWEIRDLYADREVALTAAARGSTYTILLDRVLTEEPEVLCFAKLRKQKATDMRVPALSLLPDLSFGAYCKLATRNNRPYNPIVGCAVDIYNNILRYDVYGDGKPPTERSFSTGNLFSVFGMDSNDRYASYYHSTPSGMKASVPDTREQLFDPNSLSAVGSFLMPDNPQALATTEQRRQLEIDIARLEKRAATEQFMRALAWLAERNIIVIETFVGSGKYNLGRRVSAFYMSEIYELQQNCIELLGDIYERGIKQSVICSPSRRVSPEIIALINTAHEFRTQWREAYLPAVIDAAAMRRHAKLMAVATPANTAGVSATSASAAAAGEGADSARPLGPDGFPVVSPIAKLARTIARQERLLMKKYEELRPQLGYNDTTDAYADFRQGRPLFRMPLMLSETPPFRLANGQPFADEQIGAIKCMRAEPISQLSGCGGVGKSETLAYICRQYPASQILCVAFTGQVTSNLSLRTGLQAQTIHSVLFAHTKFVEARNRARSYRKNSRKHQNTTPQNLGENFTYEQVNTTNDENELRAYIDAHIEAHPPFMSPCDGKRLLIIDEISLVNLQLFYRLLQALHNPAEGFCLERVIVCGDLDQLSAIGFGNIQSDLAHALPQATFQLLKNHRSRGTELFELARAVARHDYTLPMPSFDLTESLRTLRLPLHTMPPIVTLETTAASITDNIETVLKAIGAVENPELRMQVQILASTNVEVDKANAAVRWLYFGQQELARANGLSNDAGAVQPVVQARPNAANDDNDGTSDEDDGGGAYAREALGDRVVAAAAPPDAEVRARVESVLSMQIRVGDKIYLKKNVTETFKATRHDKFVRKKRFYNTRVLVAVQFYNAPRTLAGNVKCRCRACPAPPADAPNDFVHECMKRLDLVPMRRRRVMEPHEPGYIAYHDKEMPHKRDNSRRMAVFLEENGNYIELDVERMLRPRSRWEFGWALTTHKMQGAQQRYIISICTEPRSYVTWKHAYTAGTRAQTVLFLLSNYEAFDRTVRHKDTVRRSMMWYHLQQRILAVLRRIPGAPAARYIEQLCPNYITASTTAEIWNIFETLRSAPPPLLATEGTGAAEPVAASMALDQDDDDDGSIFSGTEDDERTDDDGSAESSASDDDAEYDASTNEDLTDSADGEAVLGDNIDDDDDDATSYEFGEDGEAVAVKRRKTK